MAYAEALQEFLKTLPPEIAAQLKPLAEKHPALGEGWLRDAEFQKKMNETKEAQTEAQKWIDWSKRNVPVHEQLKEDYAKAQAKIAEMEQTAKAASEAAAAAAAAGKTGTEIDAATLQKNVEERMAKLGVTEKGDIVKLVQDEAKKMVDATRADFFKTTVPELINWARASAVLELNHRDEFKKPLPAEEFSKFMKDNNLTDPFKAYDQFVSKQREDARIQKGIEDGIKAKLSTMGVPGTSGSPAPELGPVQTHLQKKDPLADKDVRLGDGQAGNAAAAELRAEGKF